MKYPLYNQSGEAVGEVKLADKIFGLPANPGLLHQAVIAQLSNARHSLAHTKIKSEVRGGGRKPWRQKGTGRARVGSIRSPLWRGGGVIFGPRAERNFQVKLNKKMKQAALCQALSGKAAEQQLAVVDELVLAESKTRQLQSVLKNFADRVWPQPNSRPRKILLLGADSTVARAARNLNRVTVLNLDNLNIVDVLQHRYLLTTSEVIKNLQKKYQ